jgi:Transglutaminase-like superfamily
MKRYLRFFALRQLCVLLLLTTFISTAFAGDDDKNITITSEKEYYRFELDKDNVVVKSTLQTIYRCNAFRTDMQVAEWYNDQYKIDDVSINVNGSRARYIKVEYEYYSSNNIFYTDSRICHFNMPFEKKDSENKVEFEKTILDPRYFTSVYFTNPLFAAQKVIVIEVPRWMSAELKEMNFAGYSITVNKEYNQKTDADIYTYTAVNVPAAKNAYMAPGPSHIYPHLLVLCKKATTKKGNVTFFNTLQDQYNWYHGLVKQIGNDEAVLKEKALAITNGITKPEDKLTAIYNWVQDNIRYIAFEDGIAGFKPDKAQEVMRKKYGDCKGMANLTKMLVQGAGFDARLCWIGTNHIAYDYTTPNLSVDNHMICAVKLNNKFIYLDATETFIGLQQYANRIQGRQVLIEDGDKYILERIPLMPFNQNTETDKRVLTIEGELLTGTVQQNWSGESKEYILTQAHSTNKEKLEDAFINYLSNNINNYKIAGFTLPDIKNAQSNMQLNYKVVQPGAVTVFGDEIYLDLDSKKQYANFKVDSTRKIAFEFDYKQHIVEDIVVNIPAGYKIALLPNALDINRPEYFFNLSYKITGNQLQYKKEIAFKQSIIPVKLFKQWNEDINSLSKFYLEQITLSKK